MLLRTNRNCTVDFFRGLALWWIFVDHMPYNLMTRLTLRQFEVCDAAEAFVLLAGISAGYAYGRALFRQGASTAIGKVVRRVRTIYVAHLLLFAALVAEVMLLSHWTTAHAMLADMDLLQLGNFTWSQLGPLLALTWQPSITNILPMYVAALLCFAALLPLLRVPVVMLGASLLLYVGVQVFGLAIPGWPDPEIPFNPLAWQLLIVIGAVLATSPQLRPRPGLVPDVTAGFVLVASVAVHGLSTMSRHGVIDASWAEAITSSPAKAILHPVRVANILALAWFAYRLAPRYQRYLRHPAAKPLILCGQHSLVVFCFGLLLDPLGGLLLTIDGAPAQIVANVAGAALVVAVAVVAAWMKNRARPPALAPLVAGGGDRNALGRPSILPTP